MSILVCGGAGYVGSHTVAALLEKGYEAVVVDSLEKGHKAAVFPEAKFYQGDLRDEALMDKIFCENNITAVIDFAAYTQVAESVAQPMRYYENNVEGGLSLLKSMLRNNVYHIVFSSSAGVYGEPERIPIIETDLTNPKNPYGETKLAMEKILKWYDGAYGMKSVALRYFNVAGAHKSGKIGEDHKPESHIIPIVLLEALKPAPMVHIFGDDYDTADGTCVRDYVHATDLADAHILALEKLADTNESDVYNLGNGHGFSNREIVEIAREVTGIQIGMEISPRRPGDPATLVASSEKISKKLGWKPQYTKLAQIIESAWIWHKNHPDGYEDR